MSLLKALTKACARKASQILTDYQLAVAQKKAYVKTGEAIKDAQKHGEFINGAVAYKNNLRQMRTKARRSGQNRESFINDL